jgi:hypothetical protein
MAINMQLIATIGEQRQSTQYAHCPRPPDRQAVVPLKCSQAEPEEAQWREGHVPDHQFCAFRERQREPLQPVVI